MIQKIKKLVLVAMTSSTLFTFGVAPLVAATASAATNNITTSVCGGVGAATGDTTSTGCGTAGSTGDGSDSIKTLAGKIVTIFSIVVGITAVIMIIYGGFRYITSGGDSGKVGGAKNSLIYAVIGLIIVALAQFIVHYVLNTAVNATPAGS